MTYLQHHALTRGDSRWPPHLRERVTRDAVERGALINALRVEPALGSPARGGLPATVARRDGEGWKIDGHKLYTTGIEGLAWLAVWARTDEAVPRTGVFLVPRDAPGVRVIARLGPSGPARLGQPRGGVRERRHRRSTMRSTCARRPTGRPTPAGLRPNRIDAHATQQAWMTVLLGSLYDAVATAARDWLAGFLNQRAPGSLGAPLASLPRVQEHVGEIEALLRTNRVLLDDATAAVDGGHAQPAADSGLLKYTVTGNAVRVVELALQLSGNHGLTRHNPLERHYRDVLCSRIHTPQNDAILVAAGKRALLASGAAA